MPAEAVDDVKVFDCLVGTVKTRIEQIVETGSKVLRGPLTMLPTVTTQVLQVDPEIVRNYYVGILGQDVYITEQDGYFEVHAGHPIPDNLLYFPGVQRP